MDIVPRPSIRFRPLRALAWTAGTLMALSQLTGCAPVVGGELLLPHPPADLAQKVRTDYRQHKALYHLVYQMHNRNETVTSAFCDNPPPGTAQIRPRKGSVYSLTICRAKRPLSFAYVDNDRLSAGYLHAHQPELNQRLRRIAINQLLPPPPVIPESP